MKVKNIPEVRNVVIRDKTFNVFIAKRYIFNNDGDEQVDHNKENGYIKEDEIHFGPSTGGTVTKYLRRYVGVAFCAVRVLD